MMGSWLVKRILDAIPYDGWVSAAEIATRVGSSSRTVAHIIRHHLLHVYVERKPMSHGTGKHYIYRALSCASPRRGDEKGDPEELGVVLGAPRPGGGVPRPQRLLHGRRPQDGAG